MRTLVWFRGKDLRISDHAPLREAAASGEVVPLFVLDPYFFDPKRAQALPNRIQFLLDSLVSLAANLRDRGSRLLVVPGKSVECVPRLAAQWRVDRVLAYRWVEPFGRERDRRVRAALTVPFQLYEGETLVPPGSLRTGEGRPYAVFTPFARAFARALAVAPVGKPHAPPKTLPPLPADVRAADEAQVPTLESLGIARNPAVLAGGERAARTRLQRFVKDHLAAYHDQRNRLALPGTSRLSVDLKFGTLSARQVWSEVERELDRAGAPAFLNELVWREFTHSTLWDRPTLLQEPFQPRFRDFPWQWSERLWTAWIEGKTGYPVVDASARQLLTEGFVHNRARMISASFLTKHLLIDYRRGEAHYLKLLTDGDWAQNNAGWQWSAGCGCDAQPYFRIFNPVTQGQKFDPEGDYVRRYVPELAKVPVKHIHSPWDASPLELAVAGVKLGETYPHPIVDHKAARERFLEVAAHHFKDGAAQPAPVVP